MVVSKCVCCDKTGEEHKIITCCICKNDYLYTCADLTSSEIRMIKSKKTLTWTCQKCSHIGNNLNDLKSLIMALQKEIENLKSVKPLSANECKNALDAEEIIQEISDRNARRKNLIIFGIKENPTADTNDKILHDQQQVRKVINYILPEHPVDTVTKPIRLGKSDINRPNPRPIKITLSSEEILHNLIRKAYKLRDLRDPQNIRISLDKTPRQQQLYRKMKEELAKRTDEGERNLRIKFIRGSPQIVSLN